MKIETRRLCLRPYEETDLRDALAVLGDRQTMSFYPQVYSEERVTEMIRQSIDTHRRHGYGRFAALSATSGGMEAGMTLIRRKISEGADETAPLQLVDVSDEAQFPVRARWRPGRRSCPP